MLGSVDIKVRPLKFACLVDPGKTEQISCYAVGAGAASTIVLIISVSSSS
jgi:hypothetical protein